VQRCSTAPARNCNVASSRDWWNFEEIKGENAILLGGSPGLGAGRVFLNVEGFHFAKAVLIFKPQIPQPGEKTCVNRPEIRLRWTNQLTRDYALVLMLPNEKKKRIAFS